MTVRLISSRVPVIVSYWGVKYVGTGTGFTLSTCPFTRVLARVYWAPVLRRESHVILSLNPARSRGHRLAIIQLLWCDLPPWDWCSSISFIFNLCWVSFLKFCSHCLKVENVFVCSLAYCVFETVHAIYRFFCKPWWKITVFRAFKRHVEVKCNVTFFENLRQRFFPILIPCYHRLGFLLHWAWNT